MQFERRTEASAPGAPPPTRLYLSALANIASRLHAPAGRRARDARFIRHRRFREGAEFFRAQRWTYYYLDEAVLDDYEHLLDVWLHESGGSAEVHEEIAQHVITKAYSFTSEFVFEILEPLGYYDQIYMSQVRILPGVLFDPKGFNLDLDSNRFKMLDSTGS